MVITSVRDVKLELGCGVTHTQGRVCQHEKNVVEKHMDTIHRQRWVMPAKFREFVVLGTRVIIDTVGSRVAIADVDRHDGDSSVAVKRQCVCDNVTALNGHVLL